MDVQCNDNHEVNIKSTLTCHNSTWSHIPACEPRKNKAFTYELKYMFLFKLTYHHVLTYLREKFPKMAKLFSDVLNLEFSFLSLTV